MSLWAKIGIAVGVLAIAVIGYFLFFKPTPPPPAIPGNSYVAAGKSLAEFDSDLARMASDRLGDLPGLKVRPTDAELPIGTLFIPGSSLEFDEDSCKADPSPAAYRANAFPDFEVQNAVAASVGLSPLIIQSLAKAGAQIKQGEQVTIHIDGLKRQYLDDHKLAGLVARAECLAALENSSVWMIRGYFRGQRSFVLSTTSTGKINGSTKIGDFEISKDAGSNTVTLRDPSDFGFLQLYTQVALKPASAPTPAPVGASPGPVLQPPPPPPPPPPSVGVDLHRYAEKYAQYHHQQYLPGKAAPPANAGAAAQAPKPVLVTVATTAIPARGHVYVQRDQSDQSHADAAVVAALQRSGFPVVPQVEAIASSKMPHIAQVRYFNATDLARANKALGVLKASFPDAQLKRIPLPSPDGQLEVWLPKAAH